jgi:hypothetical protein
MELFKYEVLWFCLSEVFLMDQFSFVCQSYKEGREGGRKEGRKEGR